MIEKPKKERKFLKILGKVGEILVQELLIKVGKSLVQKIGGKKTLPSIIFLSLFYNVAFASIDSIPYPITGNKQRLGWQTTGNGLVYRGNASDTITKPSNYTNKDIKAYLLLDTVNNVLYNYIASKGGWQFSNTDSIVINNNFIQPVDSLFFDTSVPTNNVDTAKMRWDSDLGTVVLGMYDQVPNEIGFKSFWLVKNQTGSTITKGSIVYANGTVGASGRITVAKFIANGSIDAKYLLGITAHDLTDGEDGYVISFGKIRQVNTDTFAAGSILYPSPTVAGVWTDVEPVAPNIDMPIGFCINSSVSNGTIAIRVASGYKLSELHDIGILSPVDKASLYYSGGLWRDTTAALLVSDTAAMLTPYLRKLDTLSLSNRLNLKLNISDTSSMLSPYFRDADTTSLNLTSRFAAKLNTSDTASMLTNYLRTGTAASTYISGSGTTNYIPKFTDTRILGNSLINDNGNYIGINKSIPTVGIDLVNDISATSAKLRLQTNFQTAQRTLELGSGDGLTWDLPGGTSQSPYIKVIGGADNVGGGGLNLMTNNTTRLFIRQNGNIGLGNVTTPNSLFEVHGSAVFNESSADADFRVESDGNANMVFVDASTDRVGIGTSSPSKTLDVNGELKIATTTATPTSLLGKDGSNVVGQLYIDGGLSIIGTNLYGEKPSYSSITGTSAVYSSDYMNTVNAFYIKANNNSTVTITLPSATGNNGKSITIKNLGTGAVNSNSSNVEPFNSTSLGTSILSSGGSKWATLVSDGTNWVIMKSN